MIHMAVVWTFFLLLVVPSGAYRSAVRDLQTLQAANSAVLTSKAEAGNEYLPPPTIEEWMQNLDLRSAQARKDAAAELGKLGKEAAAAIPKLTELLSDEATRDVALEALGQMGSAAIESVPVIVAKIPGCNSMTCPYMYKAAEVLGKIGKEDPEGVVPELEKGLAAQKWNVRWVAATVCGKLGENSLGLVPQLRRLSKYDKDADIKRAAAQSLEEISNVVASPLPEPTLAEWQQSLSDRNAQVRKDAAAELGKLGKEAAAAIPKLTELLSDEVTRDVALEALGQMGSAAIESVPVIVAKIPGCNSMTCPYMYKAAEVLGKIGKEDPEGVVPELEKGLAAQKWNVRWVAATVCGKLGENSLGLVPQLRRLSKYDKDADIKRAAAQSLEEISNVVASPLPEPTLAEWQQSLSDSNAQVRKDAAAELGKLGKEAAAAIPKLTELLSDEVTRDVALEALGQMGSAAIESVPVIVAKIPGCNSMTCPYMYKAAEVLGKIGKEDPEGVVPELEKGLAAQKWNVRWVAATVCGKLGENSLGLVPQLRRLSKYEMDADIRKAAAQSLEEISNVVASPLPEPTLAEWQQSLSDRNAQVRKDAAAELGKLGKEAAAAIPKLTELLSDEVTRDVALEALGQMGSAAIESVPVIVAKIPGCNSMTCPYMYKAAEVLGKIGKEDPEGVVPELEKGLAAQKWNVRWVAATVCGKLGENSLGLVPQLRRVSKYEMDADIRKAAAQSLEEISNVVASPLPEPTLAEWQQSLSDRNAQVRKDAAAELGKLGKEAVAAIPKLTELLSDEATRDVALEALGQMGSAAIESVPVIVAKIPGCNSMTCPYMYKAAEVLGKIGKEDPAGVVPELEKGLAAQKWNVRWVAATVCGKLGENSLGLVPQLRRVSKYEMDADIRKAAAQSLEEISNVAASPLPEPTLAEWQQSLSDRNAQVRKDAAAELGKLGKEAVAAIPKLTELLSDEATRDVALEALGQMGSAAIESVPVIVAKIPGCNSMTCPYMYKAAEVLGKIGKEDPEGVVPELEKGLAAQKWNVRWVAATVCGKLGENSLGLVPQLRRVSKYDTDADIRKAASQSLQLIDEASEPPPASQLPSS